MNLAILLLLTQTFPSPGPSPRSASSSFAGTFLHNRVLTLDHTQAGASDSANYPMLVHSPNGTVNTAATAVTLATGDNFPTWMSGGPVMINGIIYTIASRTSGSALVLTGSAGTQTGVVYSGTPWLATAVNGGDVQNTVTQTGGAAITIPADVVFTSDTCVTSTGGWEWDTYSATTGIANIWVKVPTVSHTSNSTVTECYDNTSIITQQMTVSSTWTGGSYVVVMHLPDGTTPTFADSSSSANTGTNTSTTATVGNIDGGVAHVTASHQFFTSGTANVPGAAAVRSASIWFNKNDSTTDVIYAIGPNTSGKIFGNYITGAGVVTFFNNGGGDTATSKTVTQNGTVWYHLAQTYDGTIVHSYVNGIDVLDKTIALNTTATPSTVGENPGGASWFTGKTDEYRISSTNLSIDWFLLDYNSQVANSTVVAVGTEN